VLRENVEHHVDEEENELFDKADDALSDEEIEALGQRMEAEKARKQGRPTKTSSTKKKGIVARIAEFVGLGSSSSSKKSTQGKKDAAKKKPAAKASKKKNATKKSVSRKGTSTKRASKSSASKRRPRSKKSATKKTRR
jgi:hypothetical protein